jgi:hypothetical protein
MTSTTGSSNSCHVMKSASVGSMARGGGAVRFRSEEGVSDTVHRQSLVDRRRFRFGRAMPSQGGHFGAMLGPRFLHCRKV